MSEKLTTDKREKVARLLRDARIDKGWSQRELGEKVGFSQNTIARIEMLRFSPNADQLYRILDALNLKLDIEGETI